MSLFEESFPELYRYTIQNLTMKMEVLEAFIIKQVRVTDQLIVPFSIPVI